jgi:uncharacterized protein (TIGR00255 family)
MTGFASANFEIETSKSEKLSLAIHLKSLNSRYFELTCKVPYILTNLEVGIHKVLKKIAERGHVYLTIKVQHSQTTHVIIPAINTVQQYLQAIKTIQKACKIKDEVTLATILQLPNILQVEEETLTHTTEEQILAAVEKLALKLKDARLQEGKVLALDIKKNIKDVLKRIKTIKKQSELVAEQKRKALDQVLSKLTKFEQTDASVEKTLLEQKKTALISELEKIDIHEELVRAQMHCNSIEKLIAQKIESHGKKLDFTLQELNREINTIASKCSDSEISLLTIDIKTSIEKTREQAQNIV